MPIDLDSTSTPRAPGEVRRDRFGRPYIIPPGGGKEKAYTRCTTYVGVLEDMFNLQKWQMRQVAIGLSGRKDLLLAVAAHSDNNAQLDELCKRAMEAANAHSARDTGTALHRLCERYDEGTLDLARVPEEYRRDVEEYARVTDGWEHLHIEEMMVRDDLQVAGTPDRIVRIGGRAYIADIKTGSIEWGQLKISMQLAMYANSELYAIDSGQRTPLDIKRDKGIVIHLPAGKGEATLHWVDLAAGWDAVATARDVRAWRKRKGLFTAYSEPAAALFDADMRTPMPTAPTDPAAELSANITRAATIDELTDLWRWADARGEWTAVHSVVAAERKAELLAPMLGGILTSETRKAGLLDEEQPAPAPQFDAVAFSLRSSETVGGLDVVRRGAVANGTWTEEHASLAAEIAAELAAQPVDEEQHVADAMVTAADDQERPRFLSPSTLPALIATAPTVDELTRLWNATSDRGYWTAEHTAAAAARKAELLGASS